MGWNRGAPLYTEVSSFQGVVRIEEFHCTYTVVSLFQGVGIERIRGVLVAGCWNKEGFLLISFQGVCTQKNNELYIFILVVTTNTGSTVNRPPLYT